jgi:hypothetical protein
MSTHYLLPLFHHLESSSCEFLAVEYFLLYCDLIVSPFPLNSGQQVQQAQHPVNVGLNLGPAYEVQWSLAIDRNERIKNEMH